MKKLNRVMTLSFAVAVLSGAALTWATPSFASQAYAPKPSSLRGELIKVDIDKMQLVVKDADGMEQTFRYTSQTEVTGGDEGVAGLATKAGSRVIVHYTGEKENRTATKIEVLPQQ